MKVFYNFDNIDKIKNPVVTTGSFDGVHIGHKVIINRLKNLAAQINGETVLITFHPHPRRVLYPETKGKGLNLINTQREKIFLLQKAGLDNLIIVNFTLEFSRTTSQEFVENILIGKLRAKRIIVGFNHHFGHNREGDYNYLYELSQKHDFEVEEIAQQDIENESVSSTRIRKALQEGKIQRANAYLDHQYIIMGAIKKHRDAFRVDIEEDVKLIPPEGIYATTLYQENNHCKAMVVVQACDGDTINKDVAVYPVEETPLSSGKNASIYFHKQVLEGFYKGNGQDKEKALEQAKNTIIELIY